MLDYLCIRINTPDDLKLSPELARLAGREDFFADTHIALHHLQIMIEELKKDVAGFCLTINAEIVNGHTNSALSPPANEMKKCLDLLSRREKEILKLVFEGMTNKEIANRLFISFETVKSHRKNILNKTACHNTASLVHKINLKEITGS